MFKPPKVKTKKRKMCILSWNKKKWRKREHKIKIKSSGFYRNDLN